MSFLFCLLVVRGEKSIFEVFLGLWGNVDDGGKFSRKTLRRIYTLWEKGIFRITIRALEEQLVLVARGDQGI